MENPKWKHFEPRYEALTQQIVDSDTFLAWFTAWSDLTKEVMELQANLMLESHKDVRNKAAETAYMAFERDVMAKVINYDHLLEARLKGIDSSTYPEIALVLRRLKTDAELYHQDNAELNRKVEEKLNHFNRLRSSLKLAFEDREISLHEAFTQNFQVERRVRESAFRAAEQAKASVAGEVDDLMLELMSLRQKIAEKAGLSDFRAYRWRSMYRYDYTPDNSFEMHHAIATEVVPLLNKHYEKKRELLSIDSLRPWDVLVDPQGRPPLQPFANAAELEEGLGRVFENIDPTLGEQFAAMRNGWLDLEKREGKLAMVGYCMPFPKSRRAFIYHSMFGTHADVWIMLHESGHAFHNTVAAQAQDIIWNHQPGPEFCELASQTMELLGLAYLDKAQGGFYTAAQAAQAKEEQLLRCLRLIGSAQADTFHHWLYPRIAQGLTIKEMDEKWLELEELYNPWLDWTGLERYASKGWQSPHIIMHPFYALDYKIAMFGAIEIWRASLQNQQKALEKYRQSLSLGASRSLPELFEAAGATFSFSQEHIRDVAGFLFEQLSSIYSPPGPQRT